MLVTALPDDLLEKIVLQLGIDAQQVIWLASSARRWRTVCTAGVQEHWEDACAEKFGWVCPVAWLSHSWYHIYLRRLRLGASPSVQPLERSSLPADVVLTFAESQIDPRRDDRRMNAHQRLRLWDDFTFAFELKHDGEALAIWEGKYYEGECYDEYHDRGDEYSNGMRLDVNLFDAEDAPECLLGLNDDDEIDVGKMITDFWGGAGDAELADYPAWANRGRASVPPLHAVSLEVYLTRGSRTVKLYSGALQYAKPWDDPSQMYFEAKPLLVQNGRPVVHFETWFGVWDAGVLDGPCAMCFSCNDYSHNEMTEQGLLEILNALF